MRHYLTFAALTAAVTLSSCFRAEVADTDPTDTNITTTDTKSVQFVIAGLPVVTNDPWSNSTEEVWQDTTNAATRATLQSEGITDLYIIEGNTLLKHQTSAESDFGTPTVTLAYGAHDLTFIASKAQGQTFVPQVAATETTEAIPAKWQCIKVADTFGLVTTITVSKNSTNTRQIALKRIAAKLAWSIQDAIPDNAHTIRIEATNHLSLSAQLIAIDTLTYITEANITSWRGIAGKQPNVMLLPAIQGDDCPIAATIAILDEYGAVIATHTTNTQVRNNRCTNITGTLFGQGNNSNVTLNAEWDETLNVAM